MYVLKSFANKGYTNADIITHYHLPSLIVKVAKDHNLEQVKQSIDERRNLLQCVKVQIKLQINVMDKTGRWPNGLMY